MTELGRGSVASETTREHEGDDWLMGLELRREIRVWGREGWGTSSCG